MARGAAARGEVEMAEEATAEAGKVAVARVVARVAG